MTQLDPGVQIRLIEATLDLLGAHAHLRSEDHAKKYLLSFRYVYCGLAAAVAKGEARGEGEAEECFQKLPQIRTRN